MSSKNNKITKQIAEVESEIKRTQKNKSTEKHLMMLRSKLSKLKAQRDAVPKKSKSKSSRGSSSDKGMSALASGGSGFGSRGFGGFLGSQHIGNQQVDDTDINFCFKRLNKKDPITKLKALTELSELFENRTPEQLQQVAPAWMDILTRLSLDNNRRVREALYNTFVPFVATIEKGLAPHLKDCFTNWWTLQFDQSRDVSHAAKTAWKTAIPSKKKRKAALLICRTSFLTQIGQVLAKKVNELNNASKSSPEAAQDRYDRVMTSSLTALSAFINCDEKLDEKEGQEQSVKDYDVHIFSLCKFWKLHLTSKRSIIRKAAYGLVQSAVLRLKPYLSSNLDTMSPICLSALADQEMFNHTEVWNMVLHFARAFPAAWDHVKAQKAILPKLWKCLRTGGYGSFRVELPCLLPFLSCLPRNLLTQKILTRFLSELWLSHKVIPEAQQDWNLFINTYFECFYWIVDTLRDFEAPSEVEAVINSCLVDLIAINLAAENSEYDSFFFLESSEALIKVESCVENVWGNIENIFIGAIDVAMRQKEDAEKSQDDSENKRNGDVGTEHEQPEPDGVVELSVVLERIHAVLKNVTKVREESDGVSKLVRSIFAKAFNYYLHSRDLSCLRLCVDVTECFDLTKLVGNVKQFLYEELHTILGNLDLSQNSSVSSTEVRSLCKLLAKSLIDENNSETVDDTSWLDLFNSLQDTNVGIKMWCSIFDVLVKPYQPVWGKNYVDEVILNQVNLFLEASLNTSDDLNYSSYAKLVDLGLRCVASDSLRSLLLEKVSFKIEGTDDQKESLPQSHILFALESIEQVVSCHQRNSKLRLKDEVTSSIFWLRSSENEQISEKAQNVWNYIFQFINDQETVSYMEPIMLRIAKMLKNRCFGQQIVFNESTELLHDDVDTDSDIEDELPPLKLVDLEDGCDVQAEKQRLVDRYPQASGCSATVKPSLHWATQVRDLVYSVSEKDVHISSEDDRSPSDHALELRQKLLSCCLLNHKQFIKLLSKKSLSPEEWEALLVTRNCLSDLFDILGSDILFLGNNNELYERHWLVSDILSVEKQLVWSLREERGVIHHVSDNITDLLLSSDRADEESEEDEGIGEPENYLISGEFVKKTIDSCFHSSVQSDERHAVYARTLAFLLHTAMQRELVEVDTIDTGLDVTYVFDNCLSLLDPTEIFSPGLCQTIDAVMAEIGGDIYDADPESFEACVRALIEVGMILTVEFDIYSRKSRQRIFGLMNCISALSGVVHFQLNDTTNQQNQGDDSKYGDDEQDFSSWLSESLLEILRHVMKAFEKMEDETLTPELVCIRNRFATVVAGTCNFAFKESTPGAGAEPGSGDEYDSDVLATLSLPEVNLLLEWSLEGLSLLSKEEHNVELRPNCLQYIPRSVALLNAALKKNISTAKPGLFPLCEPALRSCIQLVSDPLFPYLRVRGYNEGIDTPLSKNLASVLSYAPTEIILQNRHVWPHLYENLASEEQEMCLASFKLLSHALCNLASSAFSEKNTAAVETDSSEGDEKHDSDTTSVSSEPQRDDAEILADILPVELCTLLLKPPSYDEILSSRIRQYFLCWRLVLDVCSVVGVEAKAILTWYFRDQVPAAFASFCSELLEHIIVSNYLTHTIPETLRKFEMSDVFNANSPDPKLIKLSTVMKRLRNIRSDPHSPTERLFFGPLSARLLYRTLCDFPALSRGWWNGQKSNKSASNIITETTKRYFTPLLVEDEIRAVLETPVEVEGFTLKGNVQSCEVTAIYRSGDIQLSLVIKLSDTYPLSPVEVNFTSEVGVSDTRSRRWKLNILQQLSSQNGSIRDALLMWKKNVDKHFEGIEECPICYSIVHPSNGSLPTLACRTCGGKFHKHCLYKWFTTSSSSSCPLCRTLF